MELLLGVSISFSILCIGSFMLVNRTLNNQKEEIDRLTKEVFGTSYGASYTDSLRAEISKNSERSLANTGVLQDLLEGLPNLFKDDLDLYKEVNGYDAYVLTLDTINRVSLSVVFCSNSGGKYSYPNQSSAYEVSWVLSKVKEYRQVKERCCPKKEETEND